MKLPEIIPIIFTTIFFCAGRSSPSSAKAIKHIRSGAIVIDVRTPEEFAAGHIEGAINIPYDIIQNHVDQIGNDKEKPIAVYCRSGRRSGIAKETLERLGYKNVINGGGYTALERELGR